MGTMIALQYAATHQLLSAAQGLLSATQQIEGLGMGSEFSDRLRAIREVAEIVATDVGQLQADILRSESYQADHAETYLTGDDLGEGGHLKPMAPMKMGSFAPAMVGQGPTQHSKPWGHRRPS